MRTAREYCEAAQRYVDGVLSGEILACRWVKLACERQRRDLAAAASDDFPYRWSENKAGRVCAFVECLPHVKGRWKSPRIVLEDWQCFLLTTIFGWVGKADGLRRFRKALAVVPRKNAKTTLAAGVGLYLLGFDSEPGAEVYSAATTRDQAKISWDMAKRMINRASRLRDRAGIEALAHSILIESDGSFFKPLSRDADSLEGLSPHGAVIDELHAHKTREVFDVLDEATGARRQPLLFIISTEGDDGEGVFAEQVAYCQGILEGAHQDDSYFGIYYTLDAEDDWTDPAVWPKSNPNLGVSVFERDLEIRCRQAKANADSQASFLTKRHNIRVGAASAYFNLLAWERLCKQDELKEEDFFGCLCIFTIDLASKRDLTTLVRVYERDGLKYVFGTHYLPDEALQPGKPNYDFYRGWANEGVLTLTEGPITDYDYLERDLLDLASKAKPLHVGIDPNYNAGQFTTRMLAAGVPMVDIPHTFQRFTEPMKALDAEILAGRIRHNGDPVITFALGNVVGKKNAKGDVYPHKAREGNKIDPAVALIANMSLWAQMVPQEESMYDTVAVM